MCGLQGEMLNWTFATTRRTATLAQAYDIAQILADTPSRWLTLLSPGKYGVGKTRLLACIVNQARTAGRLAIYTTVADVLDYLRQAYSDGTVLSYDGRMEVLKQADVLCLDEFDRWNPTPWAQEKFFQIINARYDALMTRLTVFAANTELANLPGYVASRMQDGRNYVFVLDGVDVRRLLK